MDKYRAPEYHGGIHPGISKGKWAVLSNLGFSEILIIAIVALVIFGPNKLPQMGRSVGQAIREFKKATQSITEEVTKAATEEIAEKKDSSEKKA